MKNIKWEIYKCFICNFYPDPEKTLEINYTKFNQKRVHTNRQLNNKDLDDFCSLSIIRRSNYRNNSLNSFENISSFKFSKKNSKKYS